MNDESSRRKMKAGRTVQIRVNPRDCLSVVDVASKVALLLPGTSFAQVVSIALSSLLESARSAGIIPRRDGFEAAEMMQAFGDQPSRSHRRKLDITRTFELAGSEAYIPPLPGTAQESTSDLPQSSHTPLVQRWLRLSHELEAKRDADPPNWTPAEQQELDRVNLKLAEALNLEQRVPTNE